MKTNLNPSNFFILILFLSTTLFAQAPDTLWTKTYGGIDSEIAYSLDQTTDNGFIMVGVTRPNVGDPDLWLVKTTSSGDTMWTKRYGDDIDQELGRSVQQTFDSGYIITGTKGSKVWLLKTDNSGDTLWTKKFEKDILSRGYDVQQTSDSGFAVVGYTGAIGYQARDLFLVKTDSHGDTLWTKVYGGPYRDVGYSIKQTYDEGFIITGETVPLNNGQPNVWLLKLDAVGDTMWTKSYNRSEEDIGWSVIQTSDSGYAIVGQTESIATYTDVWFIKTNNIGDTLWTKVFDYGQDDNEIGYSVVQTVDDGFTICSDYNANLWLFRTNAIGTIIWNSIFGNYDQFLYSVQITNDDGYIVAGTKNTPNNDNDFLLMKFAPDPLLSIKTKYILSKFELFQNYPNPFNPSTTIEFTLAKSEIVELKIYNILGKEVATLVSNKLNQGNHTYTFKGNNLASGVYYYQLVAGDYREVKKMILLR